MKSLRMSMLQLPSEDESRDINMKEVYPGAFAISDTLNVIPLSALEKSQATGRYCSVSIIAHRSRVGWDGNASL